MEYYDVIKKRRSIRKYKTDSVPQESIDRILEAARIAPSWRNFQCWRFILIDQAEIRSKMAEIIKGNPCSEALTQAPYLLVLCAYTEESGNNDGKAYYLTDCGIVMEHILLAAAAEGLGSCFVGYFNEAAVKEALHIPKEVSVVGFTPLGYPDQEPQDRGRKPLEELLSTNTWNG